MPLTERQQVITITDPKTNTSYRFGGLVPLRRIHANCEFGYHDKCLTAPNLMIKDFPIEFTKTHSCLCECHHDKEAK